MRDLKSGQNVKSFKSTAYIANECDEGAAKAKSDKTYVSGRPKATYKAVPKKDHRSLVEDVDEPEWLNTGISIEKGAKSKGNSSVSNYLPKSGPFNSYQHQKSIEFIDGDEDEDPDFVDTSRHRSCDLAAKRASAADVIQPEEEKKKDSRLTDKQKALLVNWLSAYRKRWKSYWNYIGEIQLEEFSVIVPCTIAELRLIDGLGERKIENFGLEILGTIWAFLDANDLTDRFPDAKKPTELNESALWMNPQSDEANALRNASFLEEDERIKAASKKEPPEKNLQFKSPSQAAWQEIDPAFTNPSLSLRVNDAPVETSPVAEHAVAPRIPKRPNENSGGLYMGGSAQYHSRDIDVESRLQRPALQQMSNPCDVIPFNGAKVPRKDPKQSSPHHSDNMEEDELLAYFA